MTNFLGTDGNDTITPTTVSPFVLTWPELFVMPGAANDVIDGKGGNDVLDGGGGDDKIGGGTGNDVLRGSAGNDTLRGDEGSDQIYGGDNNDSLDGGPGYDLLYGGSGQDTLESSWADGNYDELYGGSGNDTFNQLRGLSYAYGGLGNDSFFGGLDAVVMYGDEGNDNLTGGRGGDYLAGGVDNDFIRGDFGSDMILGGDGNDTIDGIYRSATGTDITYDSIYGGNGDDYVVLNIEVLGPNLRSDYANGDAGSDMLVISNTLPVQDWELDLSTGSLAVYVLGYGLLTKVGAFQNFENLQSGGGNDTINGTVGANYIRGMNGNDLIFGNGGGDVLLGDGGDDTIYALPGDYADGGIGGYDVLIMEPAVGGVTLNLATSLMIFGFEAVGTGDGDDSLIGSAAAFEALYGGGGNDTIDGGGGLNELFGDAGNDLLFVTGGGNDKLFGGEGNDRFNLNARTSLVGLSIYGGADTDTVDLAEDIVTLDTVDRLAEIERLDVWLTTISGTTGDDNLDLGAFETIAFGSALGVAVFGLDGNDLVGGGRNAGTNDSLYGGVGNDTIRGRAGNDQIFGGDGDDFLFGGAGRDSMAGGLGSDRFVFLKASESPGTKGDVIRSDGFTIAFEGAGAAVGDIIDISGIDANTLRKGNQSFEFGGFGIGRVSLVESGSSTVVLGNTDDDADFEFRLVIQDGAVRASAYSVADFIL